MAITRGGCPPVLYHLGVWGACPRLRVPSQVHPVLAKGGCWGLIRVVAQPNGWAAPKMAYGAAPCFKQAYS